MDCERKSSIIYGSIEDVGKAIKEFQHDGTIAIITDHNVAELYLEPCAESLRTQGFRVFSCVIPPGEESKNGRIYLDLLNSISGYNLTRSDGILALGGGVIGDLAGFVAATYMRGIKVYQVPTTLLAMVDSSIGGKTGIDLDSGKNLAGAFHLPSLVFQDFDTLSTLPEEELLNGMAEVIKYGVLEGKEIYDLLMPSESQDEGFPLYEIIKKSAGYKEDVVSKDQMDRGERQLLNLGHTFGHAIEKLSDYEIKHGFAVAMGLGLIADISAKEGWLEESARDEIVGMLDMWGYDLNIPFSKEEMFEIIKVDKKRKGDNIDLIVPKEIGNCYIKRISLDEFERMLFENN